jgi:hypothetical protein
MEPEIFYSDLVSPAKGVYIEFFDGGLYLYKDASLYLSVRHMGDTTIMNWHGERSNDQPNCVTHNKNRTTHIWGANGVHHRDMCLPDSVQFIDGGVRCTWYGVNHCANINTCDGKCEKLGLYNPGKTITMSSSEYKKMVEKAHDLAERNSENEHQ